MSNLFTSQTPTGTNNSDGSPGITFATTVRFAQAGTVSGVRFYATTAVSGVYTGGLWEVTSDDFPGNGTLLASKVRPTAPTGGAWNAIVFDSAVSVTTGKLYRAGVHSADGRYVNTTSFFTSGLTNGDITADADGSDPVLLGNLKQGTFEINAALTYPDTSFGSSCYFADVEFTAGVAPTPFTKDTIEIYRLFNALTKNTAENYRVLNAFSKDAVEVYRILNAWGVDVVEAYRIFGTWTKNQAEGYRIFNLAQLDAIERYRVFAGWVRVVQERYQIGDGSPALPAHVIATLSPVTVIAYLDRIG